MDNCPLVISIGRRRVKYGYEFHWKPYASKPNLNKPDHTPCEVHVENFVASIRSPAKRENKDVRTLKVMPLGIDDQSLLPFPDNGFDNISEVENIHETLADLDKLVENIQLQLDGDKTKYDDDVGFGSWTWPPSTSM